MQPNYRQFQPGQVVHSVFGEPLVVASQLGCQVFVESKPFEWYHPSKLIPADKADTGVEKQRQA